MSHAQSVDIGEVRKAKQENLLESFPDLETVPILTSIDQSISTSHCNTTATTLNTVDHLDCKAKEQIANNTNFVNIADELCQEDVLRQFTTLQLDDMISLRSGPIGSRRRASADDEFLKTASLFHHNPTISRPPKNSISITTSTASNATTTSTSTATLTTSSAAIHWTIPKGKPFPNQLPLPHQQLPPYYAQNNQQQQQQQQPQYLYNHPSYFPSNFENNSPPTNVSHFGSLMLSTPGTSLTTDKRIALYKTEMCRTFEETGTCRYGLKCQFAHDPAELRSVPRHPRYKTEICKTFWRLGNCPYGKRCCFIHTENELGLSGDFDSMTTENSRSLRDSPKKVITIRTTKHQEVNLPPSSKLLPRIQTASSFPAFSSVFSDYYKDVLSQGSILEDVPKSIPSQEGNEVPRFVAANITSFPKRPIDPLFESLSVNSSSDDGGLGAPWEDEDPLGLVPHDLLKSVQA